MKRIGMVGVFAVVIAAGTTLALQQEPPKSPPEVQQPNQAAMAAAAGRAGGGGAEEGDGLRPWAEVSKGYEAVPGADGKSYYGLWIKKKDNSMLAELPRDGERQFIALTVSSGEDYAGLQAGDMYAFWRRIDNRMMLIEPNIDTRSSGDQESKSGVKRLFTDRVVLDVPIVCMGPNNRPVIDMKALLVGRAREFFGPRAGGNASLATIKSSKSFEQNVEISFEWPTGGGRLQEFHYSISSLPDNPSYKPRVADERVGYFTTVYRDLGKFKDDDKWVRYINRWNLEKRDPSLKLSPPKEPIIFYIEHTVPVRYRRYVREGLLDWNKAFEKVGIVDAIEVYQQDEQTGAHMDKDPEDRRYNFIRWLANDQGTAIGPSRVHPLTGQILDADIILTDGWIRYWWMNFSDVLPEMAMEGFSPETLAWLQTRPQWDPRVRLAAPENRDAIVAQHMRRGVMAYGGHPLAVAADPATQRIIGDNEYDGLVGRRSQMNGLCMAARGKAFDVTLMRMHLEMLAMIEEEQDKAAQPEGEKKDDKKDDKKPKPEKGDLLDGIPEWFIGPLLADLTSHEVGHTLGLRHNFKASSIYSLDQINSPEIKGKKPFTGSVMDYTPININTDDKLIQGDYAMIDVGAYDYWVIEYGYTTGDVKDVLKRVAEPELVYATDEDTMGPDPLARRYDFSANPLDFAKSNLRLANWHRQRLLDKFVKDGQSWARARRGYNLTLGLQTRSVSMMANWIGGSFVNRDRKGDPNARNPVNPVPAAQQRDALKWILETAFRDEAYGLTPELLSKMTVDRWLDQGGFREAMEEPAWPIHDRIAGIQSSTLTMLMNPTTLRRVFDNEFRTPAATDQITLNELFDTVTAEVFSEVGKAGGKKFTAREPMISSLRRNLQREAIDRMIDLTLPGNLSGESSKPISNLAVAKLRALKDRINDVVTGSGVGNLDPYTLAHLAEANVRITKALDAQYIYNNSGGNFGGGFFGFFGQTPPTGPGPIPGTAKGGEPGMQR